MTCRYVKKQPNCLVNLVSRGNCSKPVFTFFNLMLFGQWELWELYMNQSLYEKNKICDSRSGFSIPSIRKVIELVKGERFSLGLATNIDGVFFAVRFATCPPRRRPCWFHLKMTQQRNPGKSSELFSNLHDDLGSKNEFCRVENPGSSFPPTKTKQQAEI